MFEVADDKDFDVRAKARLVVEAADRELAECLQLLETSRLRQLARESA